MKQYFKIIILLIFIPVSLCWYACSDYPVDEDGLLITSRAECYVSNFDLLGADFRTVRVTAPAIDTLAQTITMTVLYGTDLTNLYPQFSLVTDAKLEPKITGRVDFSDLTKPKQWTVVSGNRKIRKTYTVNLTIQQKP